MTRPAKQTFDISEHVAKNEEQLKQANRVRSRAQSRSRAFEQMTDKQKDLLLKELAILAGLINDSEDE